MTLYSKIGCIGVTLFALSGCNEEMIANPDIINVGTYEGCAVKYIDRGAQSRSFYIAKCESQSTTTSQQIQSGKSSYKTATISVQTPPEPVDPKQQKITELEQQLKQLQIKIDLLNGK